MALGCCGMLFLSTGIVPSLWEFGWNTSRNDICLYYSLQYPSLEGLSFTHNNSDTIPNFGSSALFVLRGYLYGSVCLLIRSSSQSSKMEFCHPMPIARKGRKKRRSRTARSRTACWSCVAVATMPLVAFLSFLKSLLLFRLGRLDLLPDFFQIS